MVSEDPREVKDALERERERRLLASLPSGSYRRRAWIEFQRALDPLAPPKPLRPPRA